MELCEVAKGEIAVKKPGAGVHRARGPQEVKYAFAFRRGYMDKLVTIARTLTVDDIDLIFPSVNFLKIIGKVSDRPADHSYKMIVRRTVMNRINKIRPACLRKYVIYAACVVKADYLARKAEEDKNQLPLFEA